MSRGTTFGFAVLLVLAARVDGRAQAPPQNSPASGTVLERAAKLIQLGRFREAEPLARQAVAAAPGSPQAHNLVGIVFDQTGRTAEAEREFRRTLELDPR